MTSDAAPDEQTWTEPTPLTVRQQKEFVQWIGKGASFAVACAKSNVSIESACLSFEIDARFRDRIDRTSQPLAFNVRAALYNAAMKGAVTAQSLFLKEEAGKRQAALVGSLPSDKKLDQATPQELQRELDRVLKTLEAPAREDHSS